MAWEEWEQLKGEAAASSSTSGGMRLNQHAYQGGGDGADLKVQHQQLRALGALADDLRQRLQVDGDHARPATFSAGTSLSNDGLDSGHQVLRLAEVWSTKLHVLLDACSHIRNHLSFTSAQHAGDDEAAGAGVGASGADLLSVSKISDYMK
ncbi:hypothetical protein ABT026_00510 [Streptomyces sp. NPDC002734]|uniref:hypothetical protein n=1 Tax=Streptomyces sp. NPDC002734 TaxID=3154426 RepID=UPI00332EAD42